MIYSRRAYNNRCRFWNIDKKNPERQNLTIKKPASGVFFAREAQISTKNDQLDSGMLNIAQQGAIIESLDDLNKLGRKDLVEYLGEYWIVEDIKSEIKNKTTEYNRKPTRIWWITLRNGN